MDTIDPRVVDSPIEWADMMYVSLQQFGVPSQLDDANDWQRWASGLLSFPGFGTLAIPDPHLFDNWRDFAMRFNQTVGGS